MILWTALDGIELEGPDPVLDLEPVEAEVAPAKFERIVLSLVAAFTELHGGRAWVEDAPGGGAAFHVWLPRLSSDPA